MTDKNGTDSFFREASFFMSEQFENMTVVELRNYAREHQIPLPAGINKQGIIDKLKASQAKETAEEEKPAAAPVQQRQRTASIIADDDDAEYESGDLSYRQPPRAPQQTVYTQRPAAAPAKPAEASRPAQTGKADVLSSISSKAPAFNIDGVRAWHNPRSYQQSNYQQSGARPTWNSKPAPQQPAPHEQRPAAARPAAQPPAGAQDPQGRPAEEQHTVYAAENRYLKDYHSVQHVTLPELLAEGEFETQQGVLRLEEDGSGLLRVIDQAKTKRLIYVSNTQIRRFSLREGDLLSGKTKAIRTGEGMRLMVYIEQVNGVPVEELKERPEFLNLPVAAPKARPAGAAWCFGQRILLSVEAEDPDALLRAADAVRQADPEAECILLTVDRAPEDSQKLADRSGWSVYAADIAQEIRHQLRTARCALERAKRVAENGRRAVLLIDSLPRLEALAESVRSSLRASVFFGTGRALQNGGAVTVFGAVSGEEEGLSCVGQLRRYASGELSADQL